MSPSPCAKQICQIMLNRAADRTLVRDMAHDVLLCGQKFGQSSNSVCQTDMAHDVKSGVKFGEDFKSVSQTDLTHDA